MSVVQREVQDLAGQLGELNLLVVRGKARWSAEAAKARRPLQQQLVRLRRAAESLAWLLQSSRRKRLLCLKLGRLK